MYTAGIENKHPSTKLLIVKQIFFFMRNTYYTNTYTYLFVSRIFIDSVLNQSLITLIVSRLRTGTHSGRWFRSRVLCCSSITVVRLVYYIDRRTFARWVFVRGHKSVHITNLPWCKDDSRCSESVQFWCFAKL